MKSPRCRAGGTSKRRGRRGDLHNYESMLCGARTEEQSRGGGQGQIERTQRFASAVEGTTPGTGVIMGLRHAPAIGAQERRRRR